MRQTPATHGRARPTELTDAGREQLRAASTAVRAVEREMLAPLALMDQRRLREDLTSCIDALGNLDHHRGLREQR